MAIFRCSWMLVCCGALLAQTDSNARFAEQLLSLQSIGDVEASPDAQVILFTVTLPDLKANRERERLMWFNGSTAPVPGAPEGAHSPRWSRDGSRFAYIADGAIWTQGRTDKAPQRVCSYAAGNAFLSKVGNMLAWSPDGRHLAFAGTDQPAPPPADPIVISRIQYKTRTALSDNRRAHIYVVPAAGGTPRQLTSGAYDEHSIDWGGDGREIVFLSNREPDPDAHLNYDIYSVEVQSGRIRHITHTPGVEMDPHVSPDGKQIAYIATTHAVTTIDSVAEDAHVWVVPFSGGAPRELNGALDRRCTSPRWRPTGESIVYLAADHGKNVIYETPAAGGASTALLNDKAQVASLSVSRNIVFAYSNVSTPVELGILAESQAVPLTSLNSAAGWHLSLPETVHFSSFDGQEVEGWFYPALSNERRAPMILSIHGGPHGQFGYGFNPLFQFLARSGYATLAINPRGSTGYGGKFSEATLNDWGGGDYRDLMAGVDAVLKTHPDIDPERLGVTGPSYGGYMTDWIITQTPRFKAAVAVASVSDLISFYATSLYQDLVHAEFNGYPWKGENSWTLWKHSPLAHVAKAQTPTLFLHGEQDNDVHITQSEEMYTALRQRGVEAELVRYPREGHGFHEPQHILDSRLRTVKWMDRYLKPPK
jgi:dipeptidyl aminopeptidase/acylaminoacyl peptidase